MCGSIAATGQDLRQLSQPAPGDVVFTAAGDAIWNHKMSPADDAQAQSAFQVFKTSDIAFVNFEQVLADSGYPPRSDKGISMADPSIISEFTRAGINLVSIANNHSNDFGLSGIETTRRTLAANGITFSGAGANLAESVEPGVIEKKGLKVALLSFLVSPDLPQLATPATDTSAGMAPIRGAQIREIDEKVIYAPWDLDLKRMENAIKAAKKQGDFVVVNLHIHWGAGGEIDPTGKQLIAHTAIDAGADAVIGEGPFVVNGIEFYKDKPIAYSMGVFVYQFNPTRYDFLPDVKRGVTSLMNNKQNHTGIMLRMIISHDGKVRSMELLPLNLDIPEGDPHIVTGQAADELLNHVQKVSEPFGTKIQRKDWFATVDLPSGER